MRSSAARPFCMLVMELASVDSGVETMLPKKMNAWNSPMESCPPTSMTPPTTHSAM